MEDKTELKLGALGRDISDAVTAIVRQVFDNADAVISTECEIPEGFVRIPDGVSDKGIHTHNSKDFNDKIRNALPPALSAVVLTALSLVFKAPSAMVVALGGAGAAVGSLFQNIADTENIRLSDLNLDELNLVKLTDEDIVVRVTVDEKKKQELAENVQKKINSLCVEIAEYEEKMNDRHDLAVDKAFGEWVQNFLIYADGRPDDRRLQLLRDGLILRLASMKIHVYDEVVLDENGKPDIPIQDFLIDSREGDSYTRVLRPAVYSDRSILARGEIC